MDFDEFQEILKTVLYDDDIFSEFESFTPIKINQKSILALEDNFLFFKDIPLQYLRVELTVLCHMISMYELNNSFHWRFAQYFFNMNKSNINKDIKQSRPITIINKDIKALKKYSSLIKEIFSNDKEKCNFFLCRNDLLIKDLEEKKFKTISKYRYYDLPTTKIPIKKTLKDMRERYKLKNVSIHEKAIIDELPTFQYSKETHQPLVSKFTEYSKMSFKEGKAKRHLF